MFFEFSFGDLLRPQDSELIRSMSIPSNVLFTSDTSLTLNKIIAEGGYDAIALLADENTAQHCWPKLKLDRQVDIIQIRSGEERKHLGTCEAIWKEMTDLRLSRKSLLINLGGGVIGDMGGFIASTYKRGIHFVNVPTTLLSQVDASIGGKLGIDFHGLKNHIGIFQEPHSVLLDTGFLETLSERELRSGFAEMLKHGLIEDKDHWEKLTASSFAVDRNWNELLRPSVEVKGRVVAEDPREQGLRKILNFGHTLGHAIETYFLSTERRLLHGEAIAAGMILEGFLSTKVSGLDQEGLAKMCQYLMDTYGKHGLPPVSEVMELMKHDKKNVDGKINFSLLQDIGKCAWDQEVSQESIKAAFEFYENLNE